MDLRLKAETKKRTEREIKILFNERIMLSSHYFGKSINLYHLADRKTRKALCRKTIHLSSLLEFNLDEIEEDKICKNCLKYYHNLRNKR
jgi:hypothetical protein